MIKNKVFCSKRVYHCPSCARLAVNYGDYHLEGGDQLFKTKCQKCGKEIVAAFDPQKVKQAIYCKEDYEKYFMENDPIIKEPLPEIQ